MDRQPRVGRVKTKCFTERNVKMDNETLKNVALAATEHGDRVIKSFFGFVEEADPVAAASVIDRLDRLKAMRQFGATTGLLSTAQDAALKARITALIEA